MCLSLAPPIILFILYHIIIYDKYPAKLFLTFIFLVCSKYTEALNTNTPPHVIFDTTLTGVSSETVKSISAALGIPTVSASFGQEGDLRQWRSLTTVKSNYLLQVCCFF